MLIDRWLLVAVLLTVSASWIIEWRTTEIPNWLTLPALVAGLLLGLLDHRALEHFGSFVVSAVVCIAVYSLGAAGGGATKLAIAISTLLGGVPASLFLLIYGALAGLIWGFAWLRARLADSSERLIHWEFQQTARRKPPQPASISSSWTPWRPAASRIWGVRPASRWHSNRPMAISNHA